MWFAAVRHPVSKNWTVTVLAVMILGDREQMSSNMSFLGWPVEHSRQSERTRRRRKAIAVRLICQFAEAFKEIQYDLLWDAPTINAQAWRQGNHRRVTVYGGVSRQPPPKTRGHVRRCRHHVRDT